MSKETEGRLWPLCADAATVHLAHNIVLRLLSLAEPCFEKELKDHFGNSHLFDGALLLLHQSGWIMKWGWNRYSLSGHAARAIAGKIIGLSGSGSGHDMCKYLLKTLGEDRVKSLVSEPLYRHLRG